MDMPLFELSGFISSGNGIVDNPEYNIEIRVRDTIIVSQHSATKETLCGLFDLTSDEFDEIA
jgi:hypothetical protein